MAANTSFPGPLPFPLLINFATLGNDYRATRSIWSESVVSPTSLNRLSVSYPIVRNRIFGCLDI